MNNSKATQPPSTVAGQPDLAQLYEARPVNYRIVHEILTAWADAPSNALVPGTVNYGYAGMASAYEAKTGRKAPTSETVRRMLILLHKDGLILRPDRQAMVLGGARRRGYRLGVLVRATNQVARESALRKLLLNLPPASVLNIINGTGRFVATRAPRAATTSPRAAPEAAPSSVPSKATTLGTGLAPVGPTWGHKEEDLETGPCLSQVDLKEDNYREIQEGREVNMAQPSSTEPGVGSGTAKNTGKEGPGQEPAARSRSSSAPLFPFDPEAPHEPLSARSEVDPTSRPAPGDERPECESEAFSPVAGNGGFPYPPILGL